MIALNDIRIRRRWTLRLTATPLTTEMLRRISRPRASTLTTLRTLLGRILVCHARLLSRKLSTTRLLLGHGAIVHAALSLRPSMIDYIVCRALAAALLVGYRPVAVVAIARVGVLQDNVPGVQKAGEEAEAAKRDVDEGVGGAEASLDPDW